jgi:hypothetical protein
MVQTPYTFIRSYGAVLGGLGDAGAKETVCGNQLHLDANGNPYWWNGGILRDKNKWSDRYMKFSHYAQGEDWEFSTSCIKETDKIKPLGEKEMAIGEAYIKLDKSHGNKPSEEQEEEVEEEKPAEETIEEEEEEEEEE